MSEFQRALVDMTEDELAMNIACLLGSLTDIAEATGKSLVITAAPGKTPVLITDGEVDSMIQYADPIYNLPFDMRKMA